MIVDLKPSDFSVLKRCTVEWGQMDAFGHVNNTVYFKYIESGRIAYFEEVGFTVDLSEATVGPILAKATCQFLKSVKYPDILMVGTKVTSVGNSSFVMETGIFSEKLGLVAIGEAVVVCVDYKSGTKTPVPDALRDAFRELDGIA